MAELQQLLVDTITAVCCQDYTAQQIEVWTAGIANKQRWADMISRQFFVVAESEGILLGFASLAHGEYIDVLYVHKDFQNQGIANALFRELEAEAQRQGKTRLHADVSITAKSFFERKGFKVVAEKTVIRQGVELLNFKMTRQSVPAASS
jgi:putative acetyltransferase